MLIHLSNVGFSKNEVTKSFAIAAKHAKEIGFDGIAIHGAHAVSYTHLTLPTNREV